MPENSEFLDPHSKLHIFVGPTGVGKSEVAYQWALRIGAEIISADAFQVYRGTAVGTAQPSLEWQKKVPHHLIGSRDPKDNWNAVEFAQEAKAILEKGKANAKNFIVVGGAGFYLRALVEGAPAGASPDPEVRAMVSDKALELGKEGLHDWLKSRDPEAAARLHPNDLQRVCRALEKTFDLSEKPAGLEPLGEDKVLFLGLERSRENLDKILLERSKAMWEGGLLDETRNLMELGLGEDHPLWGAIGYAEAAAHHKGEMTRAQALERIFRRTRQYAKRQWTWFKHQHNVEWINLDHYPTMESVLEELQKHISPQMNTN